LSQGRRASRLPLAFIFRAFGAIVRNIVQIVTVLCVQGRIIQLEALCIVLTAVSNRSPRR
jgi:hypothetical protein